MTAIGYHGASDGALALTPLGTQANEGLLKRLLHKVVGGGTGKPRWYLLPGGQGPSTSALDVGAAPGTDVYAPVDGTIVGIGNIIARRAGGRRADRDPARLGAVARRLRVATSRPTRRSSSAAPSPPTGRSSARCSTSRRSSARRSRATRTTRATTSSSRSARPRRSTSVEPEPAAPDAELRILFVADVFGAPGRRAVEARLASLREELGVDFCIVNGENAADGRGITAKLAERLLAAGADVITLGNWAWGQHGLRARTSRAPTASSGPANLSPSSPGRGLAVHDGVAVINLLGQLTLNPFESPFLDRRAAASRRPSARRP